MDLPIVTMLLQIISILGGIIAVLWGADRLTEGAVAVAERFKVPQLIIGLTIVAIGTSMPEFTVSLLAAIKGTPDLAVGNVVGSNIFNALGIVGITAMIAPMTILPVTVRKDLPFALVASFMLVVLALNSEISRFDSFVMFALFVIFMVLTLRGAKEEPGGETDMPAASPMPMWKALLFLGLGLAGLIVGSNFFVEGASAVAASLGVSQAVIGLTIVAIGTSLPELATSVVAARKGNSGIAIGNVIGSNVFNILFILGLTGLISPMQIAGITKIDFALLIGSMMVLWLFSYTKLNIARWEGGVLLDIFVGYLTWLVSNAAV